MMAKLTFQFASIFLVLSIVPICGRRTALAKTAAGVTQGVSLDDLSERDEDLDSEAASPAKVTPAQAAIEMAVEEMRVAIYYAGVSFGSRVRSICDTTKELPRFKSKRYGVYMAPVSKKKKKWEKPTISPAQRTTNNRKNAKRDLTRTKSREASEDFKAKTDAMIDNLNGAIEEVSEKKEALQESLRNELEQYRDEILVWMGPDNVKEGNVEYEGATPGEVIPLPGVFVFHLPTLDADYESADRKKRKSQLQHQPEECLQMLTKIRARLSEKSLEDDMAQAGLDQTEATMLRVDDEDEDHQHDEQEDQLPEEE